MKSSTTNTNQHCPTVFVSDRPSSIDSFEVNKAYSRIVNALVDIVRSPDNEGMSIGVEGSLGAGKSTLINLLDTKLRQPDGELVRLIVFDAWAHEGDPLRLTFLESLVDGLKVEGWINENYWKEQLDIIGQRKEVKDTASDYGLSWFDAFIAFMFFLIPIGVPVLNSALRDEITLDRTQPIAWKLIVGIFLCIAAPVLMFLKWLWRKFIDWLTNSGETSQEKGVRLTKQTFLALLLNRTLSAGRTVVVKSPEPTSLEFEKQFQKLMSDALNSHPERRVVLVIDNLDRVQPDRAIAIWSTLQTFLQHRHYNPPNWLKQLYTIVLYDPARIIERATTEIDSTGSQQEAGPERSILDKSFQIRLEVPPPILSDWREYLLGLLRSALPKHEAEHHEIYRVLAIERQTRPPTIRELKVFVNQICAIHLQWQDAFPLKHVAYYVALRRRPEDIVDGLLHGRLPEQRYAAILGDDVQDTLVALSFNVEPDVAYQFLLATPLQEALLDTSGEKLNERATKFKNGFWEVLEHTISREWAGDQSEKVGHAILAIERSGILRTTQRPESKSVQRSLSRIAFGMRVWRPFDAETAQSLAVLCQWRHADGFQNDRDIAPLLAAIAEGLFDRDISMRTKVAVPAWVTALTMLMKEIRELGFVDLRSDVIVERIKERLIELEHMHGGEVSRLLEVLLELRTTKTSAQKALIELAEGGQIFHYFNQMHLSSNDHDVCSWCILALLGFAPSVSSPPNVGNAQYGYNALLALFKEPQPVDVQEFSKLLVRYKDTLATDIMERDLGAENFLSVCLKHIASTSEAESFFTGQFILSNWSFLKTRIPKEPRILSNPRLVEDIRRTDFRVEYAYLYRLMVENEKTNSTVFRDWCCDNLKQLTAAEWESDLIGHMDLPHLASAIKKRGALLGLGEAFQNGIVASVDDLLREQDSHPFVTLFDHSILFELIGDEQQHSVCARIYELVKQAHGDLPFGFFPSYGKFLAEVLTIDKESMDLILGPLIQSRNEEAIRWIAKLLRDKPSLLEEQSTAVSEFKRTVLLALAHPDDSITPLILEMARTIGFTNLKESLPPLPWTVRTLGESLYKFIAKEGGYFDPAEEPSQYRPPLGAHGVEES